MSEPIRETIRLYPFEDAELGDPILRQPTEQSIDYINNSKTGQKSLEDIYTNNNFLSSSLETTAKNVGSIQRVPQKLCWCLEYRNDSNNGRYDS